MPVSRAVFVPEGHLENSPRFQPWVEGRRDTSPEGTTDLEPDGQSILAALSGLNAWLRLPPTLIRAAILGRSLRNAAQAVTDDFNRTLRWAIRSDFATSDSATLIPSRSAGRATAVL